MARWRLLSAERTTGSEPVKETSAGKQAAELREALDEAVGKLRRAAEAGEVPRRGAASLVACLDALIARLSEAGESRDE